MSRSRLLQNRLIPNALSGLVIVLAFLPMGCGPAKKPQLQETPPPEITVSSPVQVELIDYDSYTGRTEAMNFVEIRARVSGYLERIQFADWAIVKEGDTLFTIDKRPYEAELKRAEGDLARLKARAERLEKDYVRIEKLIEKGVSTAENYDKVAGDRSEAIGELASAKAAVERAALDLNFCEIKAPVAGRVDRHLVSAGNLVVAGGANTGGTLLTTIVSLDPMHVYCDCSEQNMLRYQKLAREGKRKTARDIGSNVPMFIGLGNEEGTPHEGYIDFVANRVDPGTGTIRARGIFDNKKEFLTPGLFVRIRVPGSQRYKALVIPERAIGTNQGQRFVYVITPENKVAEAPVKIGTLHDGFRVIEEGLTTTDNVVVNAMAKVLVGMLAQPKPVPLKVPESIGPPKSNE